MNSSDSKPCQFSLRFVGEPGIRSFQAYMNGEAIPHVENLVRSIKKLLGDRPYEGQYSMHLLIARGLPTLLCSDASYHPLSDVAVSLGLEESINYLRSLPTEHHPAARELIIMHCYPQYYSPLEDHDYKSMELHRHRRLKGDDRVGERWFLKTDGHPPEAQKVIRELGLAKEDDNGWSCKR